MAIDPTSGNLAVTWAQNTDQGWLQFFTSAGVFASEAGVPLSLDYIAIDPTSLNVVATDFFSNQAPANGNIFVTVEESLEVQVFNAAGKFLTAFGAGLFSGIPEGIAIDPVTHNVFVSDTFGDRVLVFAQGGGKKKKKKNKPYALITQFGSSGSGNGQFSQPLGIAVDPTTGNVIVVDEDNNRVQIFAPQ